VDLTQASKIIPSVNIHLQKIREVCGRRKSEPQEHQARREKHPDSEAIQALPAFVSLVGTKFDQF
jgi:hypothetical protein